MRKKANLKSQVLIFSIVFGITFFSFYVFFYLYLNNKIYPNIYVLNYNLGFKTVEESYLTLSKISPPHTLVISDQQKTFTLNTSEINYFLNINNTINKAYNTNKSLFQFLTKTQIPLEYSYTKDKLDEKISEIEKTFNQPGTLPHIVEKNGKLEFVAGVNGKIINSPLLKQTIEDILSYKNTNSNITVSYLSDGNNISHEQELSYLNRANNLYVKKLSLVFENTPHEYTKIQLVDLINPLGNYDENKIKILIDELSKKINRSSKDPIFIFENNIVKEFSPSIDGATVDNLSLKKLIIQQLETLEKGEEKTLTASIPVFITPSKYKTSDVNNLGIKELIGIGKSKFAGSIANRVYNVGLASGKWNGVLVKPDEIISFNAIVGDATAENGFKQAYVIKDGKTELGDGGGVCQVSTTLFRAVLNAGLPIIERRAHSYRVSYYEQDAGPGLDATVFYPTTDFKFKNDTGNHILIQTKFDGKLNTLVFEIYGTSDGRTATVTKPVILSQTPPPEDLYIDDPTLPVGTIKQIDHKAWGAKVTFDYKVTRNNQPIFEKTFLSVYKPWQAKYLKGTKLP